MRKTTMLALVLALAGLAPGPASALDILLTNDDGGGTPGIIALRAALCAAGHHVTQVASTSDQSGRGGALNTRALSSAGAMALTRISTDACGVVYSLAQPAAAFGGTPVDCVRAGLEVLLVNDPPDLVVTGLNPGQNEGKFASSSSGTVGAAIAGALRGIPAIAGSVEVDLAEAAIGFPSTFAAFPPASDFVARLIAALEAAPADALLPKGVRMLNVNFPVPYGDIQGIALTHLGDGAGLAIPLFDRNQGFPPLPPIPALLNCLTLADGQACSVGVGFAPEPGPDAERNADTDAVRAGLISITPMDVDMTSGGQGNALHGILRDLAP